MAVATATAGRKASFRDSHPILDLVSTRIALGVVTVFVVSVIVFVATQILPGNAAFAVLGRSANPARLHQLELQLHLNRSLAGQYWIWLSGLFTGRLGQSFANGLPVWGLVEPRLINSAVLVFVTGAVGTIVGVVTGAVAALRKDGWFDHVTSVIALAVTSLIAPTYASPRHFFESLKLSLDYLVDEARNGCGGRLMSVGVHPRWSGQPGRASALRDFIEYALRLEEVSFMRRIDIAEYWVRTFGAAGRSSDGP